jgi:hypothetical protein
VFADRHSRLECAVPRGRCWRAAHCRRNGWSRCRPNELALHGNATAISLIRYLRGRSATPRVPPSRLGGRSRVIVRNSRCDAPASGTHGARASGKQPQARL